MDLSQFKLKEVLKRGETEKTMTLLGTFPNKEGEAIIILRCKVPDIFPFQFQHLQQVFTNDIYKTFSAKMLNKVQIQTIYPITEKHLKKYRNKKELLIVESSEMYEKEKQQLLKRQLAHINWVNNIIQGKAEKQRLLFQSDEFIILPDLKFSDLTQIASLHLIIIFTDPELTSIRDLRAHHIQLLENAQKQTEKLLTGRFQMRKDSYRVYFHYPPTFYRLHLHIMGLDMHLKTCSVDKCHLLQSVLNNLRMMKDYYERSSLPKLIEVEE